MTRAGRRFHSRRRGSASAASRVAAHRRAGGRGRRPRRHPRQQRRHHPPRRRARRSPRRTGTRCSNVNLKTPFFLAQAAAQRMVAAGRGGKIINIASMLSFQGGIRVASYTASKSGLAGLTRLLANEWAAHGHQRQRDRARLLRDQQHRRRCAPTSSATATSSAASRPAAGAGRPTSAAPRCSWRRPRRTTSTARSCRSTAAGSPARARLGVLSRMTVRSVVPRKAFP